MGRRVFIAGLATAGAARGASAQPARESHRIGWLSPAAAATGAPNLDALRQGLRELGYEEGRNLALEERWANGISERLPALARELVQLRVDVICTAGTQATRVMEKGKHVWRCEPQAHHTSMKSHDTMAPQGSSSGGTSY